MPGRSTFSPEIRRTYKKYFTKSGTLSKKKADKSAAYRSLKKMAGGMKKFGSWRTASGLRKKRASKASKASKAKRAKSRARSRRKYGKPSASSRKATWKFGKGYVLPKRRKKRGPGRPKGSKTKVKRIKRRKSTGMIKRRGPGRPKGSKNKRRTIKRRTIKRRGPGRPRRKTGRKLTKAQRSRIMKSAWRKRKQGVYRRSRAGKRPYRKLYRTKVGRPFKRARRVGKSGRRTKKFQLWRNSTKDFLMTAGIATLGAISAALLVKTLSEKVISKNVTLAKIAPYAAVLIPAAGAFMMYKYGGKLIKNQNLLTGLTMGLAFAGAIAAIHKFIIPQIPADLQIKLGLTPSQAVIPAAAEPNANGAVAGYVSAPGVRGYVSAPGVRGYIAAPRTMGALRDIGSGAAHSYDTTTEGQERQYDKFRWQGVLSKSVFE